MAAITVVGLGEAGRLYAEGLAGAGAMVRGFDPFLTVDSDAFTQFGSLEEALGSSDVVLSLVGARASEVVAKQIADAATNRLIFADLNTSSPQVKLAVGEVARRGGVVPCDAAIMAPVPRAGHRSPLVVSGAGAARFAELMSPLGAPIDSIGGEMGDAAQVKLLRSVFMKGLATLVIETLGAAEIAGQRERLANQIETELGPNGPALVERLVSGTHTHAERREHEMQDVLAELQRIGAPHDITTATIAWFRRILDEQQSGETGEK